MQKTIKLTIILNTILVLTISLLFISSSFAKTPIEDKTTIKEITLDTIPPTIELTGSETITITQNNSYTEPGYTANDNIDGNITNNVYVYTNLNNKVPGTYKVIYEIKDSSGNKTNQQRTIIVKKKEVPKQYTSTKTTNEEINNKINEINKKLSKYKVSVGYVNLDNNYTYIYNGNKEYFGASLIKVVDAMYIYENKLLDTKNKEHVKQAISISSNSSHSYLVNKIGKKTLTNYIKEISNKTPQCNSRYYCQTTVHDQISYWIHLNYLIETLDNGEELESYFINKVGNHISYDLKYDNLHKYGASYDYYHDVGMFKTDTNKYILVVLTQELNSYNKHIKYLFRDISEEISELNDLVEKNY